MLNKKLKNFIMQMQNEYPNIYNIENVRIVRLLNWPEIEFQIFLEIVFSPIFKKFGIPEDFYEWIVKNGLGEGVFWELDEIWDRVRRITSISDNEAKILMKNARNFLIYQKC